MTEEKNQNEKASGSEGNALYYGVVGCFGLLFLLFLGAGIFFVTAISGTTITAYKSSSWPSVEGVVVSSKVVSRNMKDADGRSRKVFSHDIIYEYHVDGEKYEGSRISFSDSHGTKEAAKLVTRKYPLGAEVLVHYDPDDPSSCTIETGTSPMMLIILASSCLFVIVLISRPIIRKVRIHR